MAKLKTHRRRLTRDAINPAPRRQTRINGNLDKLRDLLKGTVIHVEERTTTLGNGGRMEHIHIWESVRGSSGGQSDSQCFLSNGDPLYDDGNDFTPWTLELLAASEPVVRKPSTGPTKAQCLTALEDVARILARSGSGEPQLQHAKAQAVNRIADVLGDRDFS